MLMVLVGLLLPLFTISLEVAAQGAAAAAYAPTLHPCPLDVPLVREVGPHANKQTLSRGETDYVSARQSQVLPRAWAEYLASVQKNTRIALPSYVDKILHGPHDALPTLGIATSGGGHRAAIFGAGILNALDGRNRTSVFAGTGGLLQAATYLSGLSGGSWLVSSLAQADFPTLPDLIFGHDTGTDRGGFGGWLTQIDLLQPSPNATETAAFIGGLLQDIALKRAQGFPVTITDVWGRALARHFVNGTTAANFFDASRTHGAGVTLSSIADLPTFAKHSQPFPIIVTNTLVSQTSDGAVIEPGNAVPLNDPIYEFNVFETGSFDPALGAFTPTRFLGSPNRTVCATGFDQLSFIEGASSDLFNQFNISEDALESSTIGPIIKGLQQAFPQTGVRLDAAAVPNPFFGISKETFPDTEQRLLALVDGGENGEVTPFQPLLVKARGVDTIIAIDAPADTIDNWSNGSSVIATKHRVELFRSTYSFPPVPASADIFVAQNLTRRPTFFGCDSPASHDDPLVIYIANGGPPLGEPALTNRSTNQLQYSPEEVQAMLNEIHDVATQGISTHAHGHEGKDPQWPACLACAVVDRARRSVGTCLARYCWS
ncbi:lysophospholipase [Fomes fomentarius]|nr:lysophospholipase [Fomes fomentarius]